MAKPRAVNACRNYFPREYMTSFKNPRDQRGFREVEVFMPREERDKVNRNVDSWPGARSKKKEKRKAQDED